MRPAAAQSSPWAVNDLRPDASSWTGQAKASPADWAARLRCWCRAVLRADAVVMDSLPSIRLSYLTNMKTQWRFRPTAWNLDERLGGPVSCGETDGVFPCRLRIRHGARPCP